MDISKEAEDLTEKVRRLSREIDEMFERLFGRMDRTIDRLGYLADRPQPAPRPRGIYQGTERQTGKRVNAYGYVGRSRDFGKFP